ncbi:MAG: tetratricopeptide repeat protein [Treponema sp.]|jgi:tetratricopeptide (TPR) repeat protein|nr:tetratricopeptide repeat protein [Treponema sp.]
MKKNSAVFIPASIPALFFRSVALFIILFQFRLIAADLADTSIFTATLLAGFAAASFLSILRLNNRQMNPIAALISIGLIPWVGRALIALPRLFISGRADTPAIILDSMLLNLDRNNFVSLFPYYWSAVSTWFSLSSAGGRKFLRASIIADAALFLFIYSVTQTAKIEVYRWPIVMIVLFSAVVFLQALALLFSMPPETKLRVKEICFAVAALVIIIVFGGYFFLKPLQEQAVKMGGGLLEPKFFSLGFSKYPKLNSEISTKNDLVMVVKKDNDENFLLRELVLSGYSKKHGFYQIEELDEKTHLPRLPSRQTFFEPPEFEKARYSFQEYFLVNIDPSSFIAMKEPLSASPYENWNASSFKSAYGAESLVSTADFSNLYYSTNANDHPTYEQFGFSEEEFKIYTDYGNDERFLSLAEEITAGYGNYADKVISVLNFLKEGEYRYSLKPGIAPDGDQLGYFLFQVKKGYCTYYAFAYALLLRSLGIPARVAAGFFVDPQTNTFDYYPVRSDMAHAWVEVAFPRFGWIEFDPTTEKVAENEELQFSSGVDPALFEKLMREIFENRYEIKIREDGSAEARVSSFNSLARKTIAFIKNYYLHITIAAIILIFLYIRCGILLSVFMTRNFRKKSTRILSHARRRLNLAGIHRDGLLSEAEWALGLNSRFNGIYPLCHSAAAARFAPKYSKFDFELQWENYKLFCVSYRKEISLGRRIILWLIPPLALALNSAKKNGKALLLIFLLVSIAGSQIRAQDNDDVELKSADELFKEASSADYSENWERAIELYREGGALFPRDARFPWALGNLYYGRSLFGLAWDEYQKTQAITPDNPTVLNRLARTAGYMNRDTVSVDYYEQVLELEPHNREAIGSLGWMYFKVHRLADGEKLLKSAIEHFGEDADFSMTLGTVYSDMYRYDESKYWYNKAISMGEYLGDRVFTAIAWYNLSILESHFYSYDFCMNAVNNSLNIQNRASGRLALGEIYMRRLELEKSQREYNTAYGIDTSPLAKLNLAQVYQMSGRLEEARLYAEDCLKGSDNSWMLNFGIDPDRYKRDIHLILTDTYSGLVKTEKFLPWAGPRDKIRSLLRITTYKLKHAVNLRLYRKYCLAAANAYYGKLSSEGGAHLDSYIQYCKAFKDYPRRAISYLNKAREFETALIPASIPSYDIEEGILLGNENLTEKALSAFDPLWEKEFIALCYSEFANPKKSSLFSFRRQNREISAEELFALNRGALRQRGIKLPVKFNIIGSEQAAGIQKTLEKALVRAGFGRAAMGTEARFTLNVIIDATQAGYSASCRLVDKTGKTETPPCSIPLRAITRAECYSLARALGNAIFTVE